MFCAIFLIRFITCGMLLACHTRLVKNFLSVKIKPPWYYIMQLRRSEVISFADAVNVHYVRLVKIVSFQQVYLKYEVGWTTPVHDAKSNSGNLLNLRVFSFCFRNALVVLNEYFVLECIENHCLENERPTYVFISFFSWHCYAKAASLQVLISSVSFSNVEI